VTEYAFLLVPAIFVLAVVLYGWALGLFRSGGDQ
jgi:hypothetical protein